MRRRAVVETQAFFRLLGGDPVAVGIGEQVAP